MLVVVVMLINPEFFGANLPTKIHVPTQSGDAKILNHCHCFNIILNMLLPPIVLLIFKNKSKFSLVFPGNGLFHQAKDSETSL